MSDRLTDAVVDIATQLRRIADAADAPATTCSAQGRRFDPIRNCIRAAHHTGLDHVDEHGFHWSDTVAVYPVADAPTTADDASALRTELHAQDERIEELEARRDELAATLHDVLRHFTQKGHPGEPCLQTGWIAEKTVARWRAVLNPPATEEQQPDAH